MYYINMPGIEMVKGFVGLALVMNRALKSGHNKIFLPIFLSAPTHFLLT
jgi:hypothetical protein